LIENPLLYLFILSFIATFFYFLESKTELKLFKYIPAVVIIYTGSMFLASMHLFDSSEEISVVYKRVKENLLPAMLFLMLLQVDIQEFLKLGKSLLQAYFLALFSLVFAFVVVAYSFDFSPKIAGAFGALAGSWMGGTANMIAVGSALHVPEDAFAYALVVDSVNYTLWLMLLLFAVPFSHVFDKFTKAKSNAVGLGEVGCACKLGTKRYWSLLLLALAVSFLANLLANTLFVSFSHTTSIVLLATLFGILGSFTRLRELNGSSELATSMLYILVALIGSRAVVESFNGLGVYVFAGFSILVIHMFLMVLGAKLLRLDLFSISVASLANIGGVASAPILAATYNKSLVGVGILMAIMGYLIGTFGGLLVGTLLIKIAL
jgi:uncharacterized membrane protein